jgi:hypothetical protein
MSLAPRLVLSWQLGFRIREGWLVQELPPEREKSAQDTAGIKSRETSMARNWRGSGSWLGLMPIPGFLKLRVELVMHILDALRLSEGSILPPTSISPTLARQSDR